MTKTPELKTKLKIIINIIMPVWLSLMLLRWKLGDVLPELIYTVDMVLGLILSILNLIVLRWNKTIDDSKSEKLQEMESISTKITLVIIVILLLILVFWRK